VNRKVDEIDKYYKKLNQEEEKEQEERIDLIPRQQDAEENERDGIEELDDMVQDQEQEQEQDQEQEQEQDQDQDQDQESESEEEESESEEENEFKNYQDYKDG
jgi:hypothetical protein